MTGSSKLIQFIDLNDLGSGTYSAVHQVIPSGRAYGGETVAQAIAATMQTVEGDRQIHSFHGLFLRAADVNKTSVYAVDSIRDGRTFSARSVTGSQLGRATFKGLASYHVDQPTRVTHQPRMPELPDPETLPTSAEVLATSQARDTQYWSFERNFDIRHCSDPVYETASSDRGRQQTVWIKSYDRLPDDPRLHQLALAYVCDYTLLEPVLRHHGAAWADPGLVTASMDHAMWWHNAGRADDWIALVQDSPEAGHGLALTRASLYSRDGNLLASATQQGLVQLPN